MPSQHLRTQSLAILLSACCLLQASCRDEEPRARPRGTPASRVLPVNADSLDYMSWLGALDLVVGLPRTWKEYGNADPARLEKRGLPLLADFRAEAVMVFEPDLVLIDGTQSLETRRQLAQAGIDILVLERFHRTEDLIDNMRRLAARIGRVREGEARIGEFEKELAQLGALRERRVGKRPRILPYFNYNNSVWSAGEGSVEDWMIRIVGAENVAREYGLSGNKEVRIEFILESPPDWILVSEGEQAHLLKTHPRLGQLAAVREGRIIALAPQLRACSSPYIIRAARQVAERLK